MTTQTQMVMPGDILPIPSSSSVTLGPGISSANASAGSGSGSGSGSSSAFISTKLGVLQSSIAKGSSKGKEKGTAYWVESTSKRYIPSQKELVLGTIIARHAEGYRVDIGSSQMAQLDALAFEGATKRSKPNLKLGTLVYARVSLAHRDMEPEVECFDPATGKSEGFGELKGGLVLDCSLQLCRKMLSYTKYPLLSTIASLAPFETAVGLNGRVWMKTQSIAEGIAIKRVIEDVNDGLLDGSDKQSVEKALKGYLA